MIPLTGHRYLREIRVQLYEIDHVSRDDPSDAKPIPTLNKHNEEPGQELTFDFEGGIYVLRYNLSSQIP